MFIAKLPMQDWNQLRFFLALSSHGTLARAAEKLQVNQSTVFRRLKQLEDDLGFSLFIRTSTGYQLTSAGEQILKHAQSIEDHFDQLKQTTSPAEDQLAGNIRVSTLDTVALQLIPQVISQFRELHPLVHIDLMVSESRHNLARREADIAIRATRRPPDYLIGKKIFSQPWCLWASQDYLDQHGYPEKGQLAQHKFLLGIGDLGEAPIMPVLEHMLSKDQVVCRSNSMLALQQLCRQGVGLLPGLQCETSDLINTMDFPEVPPSELWLLYHPDQKTQPRIKAFTQFIMDNFKRTTLVRI